MDGLWTVCRWSGLIRGGGSWTSGDGSLVNFGGRLNDFLGGFKLKLIRSSAERVETGGGQ